MGALLQPFARLVEAGKLDEVLSRLPAFRFFNRRAGIGAGEWRHARAFYEAKRVGAECMAEYRGNDTELARNPTWRQLATNTVRLIQRAVLDLAMFRELRARSTPCCALSIENFERIVTAFKFEVFRLPADELLPGPDWLNACEAIPRREPSSLPVRVADARGRIFLLRGLFSTTFSLTRTTVR